MLLTKLRDYQEEAVARALESGRTGFGIFSDPRSGKTLISIAIADHIEPHRLLIICPKKAIRVWEEQIKEHWSWDNFYVDVEVLNYEQVLTRRHELKKWIQKADRSMVIIDESHRIKRRGSKQGRACRLIGKYASYRLALTGTPISKGESIQDAWAQFNFIDPTIFSDYESFENRFLVKGGFKGKKVIGYKNKKKFYQLFHANSFRRTLREVRKKPLLIRRVRVDIEMHGTTEVPYQELERTLRTVVKKRKVEVKLIVSLSTKLQQLTGGWLLGEGRNDRAIRVGREKESALLNLLSVIEKKIVICVKYLHEVSSLVKAVSKMGRSVKTIQGGVDFDGDFDTDVIVIQIQSGLAIDLSAARTIIWYSWDYSYINHQQMRFRVLSYDTRQITYYYLIMKNSIDEQIYEAIARKKKLADLVCDHYRRKVEHVG